MKKKKVVAFFVFLIILAAALSYLKIITYGSSVGLAVIDSPKKSENYILSPSSPNGIFIFLALLLLILVYKYIHNHEKRISAQMTHSTTKPDNEVSHLRHALK
jgi:uncharacterized BrkB/YihY/UPF0761 family membrane protein